MDEGYRPDNPFSKAASTDAWPRQTTWTPELVEAFKAKAIEMGRTSLAAAVHLSYDLCQRQNDVIGRFENTPSGGTVWQGMSWHQVRDGNLILRQNKTGQMVAIPLDDLPATSAILAALPRFCPAIIANETTQAPYTTDNFRHEFRRVARAAGIPEELQFRDCRRTGPSELGDAGATDDEVRAVSGHRTANIVATYLVRARPKPAPPWPSARRFKKKAQKSECA